MTFIQLITTLLEISAFIGLIWCIFHEDTLVAFEERIFAAIRRKRLRVVKERHTPSFNYNF
jgi:hypothetical protein